MNFIPWSDFIPKCKGNSPINQSIIGQTRPVGLKIENGKSELLGDIGYQVLVGQHDHMRYTRRMKHGAQFTRGYLGRATFLHTAHCPRFALEEYHPPKSNHVVERTLCSRIKSIPTLSYTQETFDLCNDISTGDEGRW